MGSFLTSHQCSVWVTQLNQIETVKAPLTCQNDTQPPILDSANKKDPTPLSRRVFVAMRSGRIKASCARTTSQSCFPCRCVPWLFSRPWPGHDDVITDQLVVRPGFGRGQAHLLASEVCIAFYTTNDFVHVAADFLMIIEHDPQRAVGIDDEDSAHRVGSLTR